MSYINTYYDGDNVIVLAVPDAAHEFAAWTGDVPSGHETDNPLSLLMDQNRTIVGTFNLLIQAWISLNGKFTRKQTSNFYGVPQNRQVEIVAPFDFTIMSLWAGVNGNFGSGFPMAVRYKVNGVSTDSLRIEFTGSEGVIVKSVTGALQIPMGQTVCYEVLGIPFTTLPFWLSTAYAIGLVSSGTSPVGAWAIAEAIQA